MWIYIFCLVCVKENLDYYNILIYDIIQIPPPLPTNFIDEKPPFHTVLSSVGRNPYFFQGRRHIISERWHGFRLQYRLSYYFDIRAETDYYYETCEVSVQILPISNFIF